MIEMRIIFCSGSRDVRILVRYNLMDFLFQVALFQLPDVTLMVSVYTKRSMKRKDMIGWFALGLNSSGEEELAHWNQMRDSKGEQVCRWHVLIES